MSARRRPAPVRRLAAGVVFLAVVAAFAAAAATGSALAQARRVSAIEITVADAERSTAFFRDVLTFEKVADEEVSGAPWEALYGVFGMRARIVTMRLGGERVRLVQFLAPEGAPVPADLRGNDLWFQHIAIVVSDMARAYARLREHRVRHISSGPQRLPDWNPNAGGIEAFYFKDPDGHALELIRFPPGKGDPRWQAAATGSKAGAGEDRLFLGIDHTAITVSDTESSLRFWRDRLGFKVAGASENYGPEQEHLNNVFGARLRITALRAPEGPGVELLEYLAPRGGRPRPAGTRANDGIHWQTEIGVVSFDDVLDAARGAWISPGAVRVLPEDPAGVPAHRAALVADPDGHAVELQETTR